MQSKRQCLTKTEKTAALNLLTKLVVLRGESVKLYGNLAFWVEEFEKDGYTLDDISKVVECGKNLPKFNTLSYGDLITAFKENGHTVKGFEDYKDDIRRLNETIGQLRAENSRLKWYQERWEMGKSSDEGNTPTNYANKSEFEQGEEQNSGRRSPAKTSGDDKNKSEIEQNNSEKKNNEMEETEHGW